MLSRLSYSDRTFENASGRVTWQIAPRHRIAGFWDAQAICRTCTGATPGGPEPARVSPEAVGVLGRPLHATQVTFLSPLTSRLILDAGFGGTFFGVGNFERAAQPDARSRSASPSSAPPAARRTGTSRASSTGRRISATAYTGSYLWKAALSYVTGSHSVSVGYQHTFMTDDRTWMTNDQNLTYRVNNGVPNQLTQSISPWVNNARVAWQARLPAGAVDAQPAHAAGRGQVRPGLELVSGAAVRGHRGFCRRRSCFPRRAASTAIRT